jgi:putative ABC transport system permease protein
VPGLVLAQVREFALWVLAANVIAWPAIAWVAGKWLHGFAYRVSPGIGPAVIAAAFSLAVSLLAVGAKAVRSSLANPVDSLKYE